MLKTILFYLLLFFVPLLSALALLIIGANIGGNYFVDFEVFGLRGYEATGTIGLYLGFLIGLIIDLILFVRKYRTISN